MAIVVIGYMVSGKSSIGKKLAQKLNIPFIDLDDYITDKEHMNIAEIFDNKGEIYFRKIEMKYLLELLEIKSNFVLAVGGGTPCYGNNINIINDKATSFYLKASLLTIYDRLSQPKNKNKRPLVSSLTHGDLKEFIAKHLFERRSFYEKADYIISVDNRTKKDIVKEISSKMP